MANFSFQYDLRHNLQIPDLILAEPTQIVIGSLDKSKIKNLKTKLCFTNISDASFEYHSPIGEIESKYFSDIVNLRTILIVGIGWFQITASNPILSGIDKVIKVTLKSLENEFASKKIEAIESEITEDTLELYYLHNVSDTSHSILHLVCQQNPSWNIGTVDTNISTNAHFFNTSSDYIYNFLTNDVSKSYNCIFVFDSFERKIHAYSLETLNNHTGIYLSFLNLMNESSFTYNLSDVVTCIKVLGGNDADTNTSLTINEISPSGNSYLYNYEYFKYMLPQETQDKLTQFKTDYDNNVESFTKAVTELQELYIELENLQSNGVSTGDYSLWGLDELEIELQAKEAVLKAYLNQSADLYNATATTIATIQSCITSKELEIENKNNEIESKFNEIQTYTININDYLTETEQVYLSKITLVSEYQDSSFECVEGMTLSEKIEIQKELLKNASEYLDKVSKPSYTLSVNCNNFINILGYENFTKNLELGGLLTIDFDETLSGKNYVVSRLLSIDIDWDDLDNFTLEFSSKSALDGKFSLNDLIDQTNNSTDYISYNSGSIKRATNKVNKVDEFINGTLNATFNKLIDTTNQEVTFDHTGLHLKEWNNESKSYKDNQIWQTNNGIYMSKDAFRTKPEVAIGELVMPDGHTEYGIIAPLLIGKAVIGNTLWFENESGTLTFNSDGLSVYDETTDVKVITNPNDTEHKVFKIQSKGSDVFFIANDGEIYTVSNITGGTINIGNGAFAVNKNGVVSITKGLLDIGNGKFVVTLDGKLKATEVEISGNITGSNITGSRLVTENKLNGSRLRIEDSNIFLEDDMSYIRGKVKDSENSYSKIIGISSYGNIVIGHDDNFVSLYNGERKDINCYTSSFDFNQNSKGGRVRIRNGGYEILDESILKVNPDMSPKDKQVLSYDKENKYWTASNGGGGGVGEDTTGDKVTVYNYEGEEISVTCDEGAEIFNCYKDYTGNDSEVLFVRNIARGIYSHAEGSSNIASGDLSHAEGYTTESYGYCSHSEGYNTIASGDYSHAEGNTTRAYGIYSHAEGNQTASWDSYCHSEGLFTQSLAPCSHAEGIWSKAEGYASHAEGNGYAGNVYSHAEGDNTNAFGMASHSEGSYTYASGDCSHVEGCHTTSLDYQHVQGHRNNQTTATAGIDSGSSDGTAFCIGNGTLQTPSNAYRVTYDGTVYTSENISSGADYAEYFEWEDGNPNNEDRIGYFVTLNNDKIMKATFEDDYILGVVSGTASVIGNGDEDWQGKFIHDDYGRLIYETYDEEYEDIRFDTNKDTNELIEIKETKTRQVTFPKVNPEYDNSKPYIQRGKRQEWDAIGMLGMLYVRDDGTCKVNGFCKCNDNGIATSTNDRNGYRVIKRINNNVIRIILK